MVEPIFYTDNDFMKSLPTHPQRRVMFLTGTRFATFVDTVRKNRAHGCDGDRILRSYSPEVIYVDQNRFYI